MVGVIALGSLGCKSTEKKFKYQTPEEAFKKGEAAFQKKRYTEAIDFYKGVFDFGRTNEWADDAQFALGKAYQASKDYSLAEQEYMRFINLYRADPRSLEAEYQRLYCYFALSPTYELDQTDTERAITQINIFLQRYPNDSRNGQLTGMLKELREKLAHKAYEAGKTYEGRGYYQAAALTYEQVLDKYADTQYADDALLAALRAHVLYAKNSIEERQAERYKQAVVTYNRLVELFPKSDLLKQAEALYTEANAAIQQVETAKTVNPKSGS